MSAASTDLNAAIPASKSATRLSFTMQCTVKSRVQDRCPDVTTRALRVVEIHARRNAWLMSTSRIGHFPVATWLSTFLAGRHKMFLLFRA